MFSIWLYFCIFVNVCSSFTNFFLSSYFYSKEYNSQIVVVNKGISPKIDGYIEDGVLRNPKGLL